MNIKALNRSLERIIEKKNILSNLNYDSEKYDKIEEELHDLEDNFLAEYGTYLGEALQDVHDEYCPDNDVLLPIAYLANKYMEKGKNADGSIAYDIDFTEGVPVDADDFPGQDVKLVLMPNPARLLLQIDKDHKEEVWIAD